MKLVVDASVAIKWMIDEPDSELATRIDVGPIVYRPLRPLASSAAALARALDHPVYDCFYLALAEAENVPLVTADRRLMAALRTTPLAGRVRPLR